MRTSAVSARESTAYIIQTYVRGMRGSLRPGEQIICKSETHARMRAAKIMAAGHVLGADVVRQMMDAEIGEYGEPEFLERLGQVPVEE